ncbi:MAG TPA: hypothetical protein DCP02_02765, partial [Actinobacteria bacterium]|nr:hypothetical protein [Actinomycetota bacterium]
MKFKEQVVRVKNRLSSFFKKLKEQVVRAINRSGSFFKKVFNKIKIFRIKIKLGKKKIVIIIVSVFVA